MVALPRVKSAPASGVSRKVERHARKREYAARERHQ
jgi:hypothetical protein